MSTPVRPEGSPCRPDRPEAFAVSNGILDNETLHAIRVCQYHAKANPPTVVLHIERAVRQTHRLREIVDHGSDVIERVIEPLRVRPVAVPKPRIIGRDKMITIGKPHEERFEHSR